MLKDDMNRKTVKMTSLCPYEKAWGKNPQREPIFTVFIFIIVDNIVNILWDCMSENSYTELRSFL